MRSDGFTGPCVHSTSLPTVSCAEGMNSYLESQGYRKIAGDVCSGGVERLFGPIKHLCQSK